MGSSDVQPLKPEQMLEAYRNRFKTTEPFTEDALLTLARICRGIFRRFLRYIQLVIELWETRHRATGSIDLALVKEAITTDRLAEDMELELSKLFPRPAGVSTRRGRYIVACGTLFH